MWRTIIALVVVLTYVGLSALPVMAAGAWTTKTSMPAARSGAAAGVINGVLYVAGGHDGVGGTPTLQAYNPATDTWNTLAPMPGRRYNGDGAGVINGELYVAGGWNYPDSGLPQSQLFVYDPVANSWSTGAPMPQQVLYGSSGGASGVINGKLYVTTPENGYSGRYPYLHVYDPATNSWSQLASSPNVHDQPAFGVIDNKFYVAGGLDANGTPSDKLDVYDQATNTWTTKAPMPAAGHVFASVVLNNKLYAIGGTAGGVYYNTVYVYDPATNTWTTETSMPTARFGAVAGVINGILYVAGGANSTGTLATVEALTLSGAQYTITATAGANGSISPAGVVAVNYGANQTFAITPNTGYHIADVLVDGLSVGAVASYNFTNVTANHTIAAAFTFTEEVVFADAHLEATVRSAIGKWTGAIYPADLAGLTSLNAGWWNTSNLAGLEHATSLTSLYLSNSQISDLSPLANLTNLTSLSLSGNYQISDLSPLANLTSLTSLNLYRNGISDLSPLANLISLTSLNLMENGISDLSPLANLTSLTTLYLGDNQISDLSPLANLTSLTSLGLSWNQLSDLSPLANLTSLTDLVIGRNQASDLSPLANLTSLTYLLIGSNGVSDLSPLANLTSLTYLHLGSNQISDLSPLANLTSLTFLDLGYNQISDLSPLANLTSLTYLDLGLTHQISDLSPLANLTSLTSLGLWYNQISDLSPLANLTSLTGLDLRFNQISDIAPLVDNAGLAQGDYVNLSDNPLSATSMNVYIPQLTARGVTVYWDTVNQNQPPVASSLAISPSSPTASDNLTASYSYSDAEGNAESGSEIRWYQNGVLQSAYNDQKIVPASATADGEQWHFTVKPKDGIAFGNLQTSASATIGAVPVKVKDLPAGRKVWKLGEPSVDLTVSGQTVDTEAVIGVIVNSTKIPVVGLLLSFSQMTADIDFTNQMVAEADLVNGKAVFHRPSYPSGVGTAKVLYVKKLSQHDRVRVVPGATTLAEVYSGAPGSYVLTLADSNLSIITTLGGEDFWRIGGLTGTGAMGETTNQPPFALFTYSPVEPKVNQKVTFNASAAYDLDGTIVSYGWEFGDGGTATGQTAEHSYTNANQYIVILTVTDNGGGTDTKAKTITVTQPATTPPTTTGRRSLPDPSTLAMVGSGLAAGLFYIGLSRLRRKLNRG